jgi:hypothetical protein
VSTLKPSPTIGTFFVPYARYRMLVDMGWATKGQFLTFVKVRNDFDKFVGCDCFDVRFVELDLRLYDDGLIESAPLYQPEDFWVQDGAVADHTLADAQLTKRLAQDQAEIQEQEKRRIAADVVRRLAKRKKKGAR